MTNFRRLTCLLSALLGAVAAGPARRGETPPPDLETLSNNSAAAWPAPDTTGGVAWTAAFARAKGLADQMTVEEKVTFVTGQPGRCEGNSGTISRLNVGPLCFQDGPAGVRPALGSSQFSSGQAAAATWNRDLIFQRGVAMGQEFFDHGINTALSPVTGGPLGRSAFNGRLWEGFFADPYGTGIAAYQTIAGMKSSGIMTTAKHWIGYEQETFRDVFNPANQSQLPISENIDDKATHELYMWGFAEAVRAGSDFIMCSYNEINQTHSCSDAYSQNHLLKEELNFQGAIISDWGATWGDAEFINAGLDITMPGGGGIWNQTMVDLVNNGTVSEDRLTDAVIRVLTPWIASGQADSPPPPVLYEDSQGDGFPVTLKDVRLPATMDLIRQLGEESATLLKNVNGALPLTKPKSIGIIGEDAGPNSYPSVFAAISGTGFPQGIDQGTLTLGGGSGWEVYPYMNTPYESINTRGRKMNAMVYNLFNDTAYDAAQEIGAITDVALVFVSQFRVEGTDNQNLLLDRNGEDLINMVADSNNNTIVVIHTGGPVFVESWFHHPNVTAVVVAHYPGQEAGDSITSVLFGDISPSGKMPYTTAVSMSDYEQDTIISDPVAAPQSYFNESTLIDYRWFKAMNITPRFAFGSGMSYSTFEYANINVQNMFVADNTSVQRTNETLEGMDASDSIYDMIAQVTADVTNTGNWTASEVAQLYLTLPGSEAFWLRGFDKLQNLAPGEMKTATFDLRRKDFSLWSTENQTWFIPSDEITIEVGPSSVDLPLMATWSSSSSSN